MTEEWGFPGGGLRFRAEVVMSDIVQQLRDLYPTHPVVMEAAAEIERLRELLSESDADEPLTMGGIDRTPMPWWRAR